MSSGVLLRVLPPALYAGRAHVLVQRAVLTQRMAWMAVLSGFFEPLFYLVGIGYGLGRLVGDGHAAQGDGEVCGTAIESPMHVAMRFDLLKREPLGAPRFVTPGPVSRTGGDDGQRPRHQHGERHEQPEPWGIHVVPADTWIDPARGTTSM